MQIILQDIQHTLRQLRRELGLALTAILRLGLAIGVLGIVFSLLEATILRQLPFKLAERIVRLQTCAPEGYTQLASWPQYLDWWQTNATVTALVGYRAEFANPESTTGAVVVELHSSHEAASLFSLTATLAIIGHSASLLPTRRAASINLPEALRAE